MSVITQQPTTTRRRLRAAVLLPAVALIAAAASQIDAAVITNAYRSVSPASDKTLNFPWYGGLAGQISTWWSFAGLFLMVGFAAFARSRAVGASRSGRIGAWTAVVAAAGIVVANFLSAANADAMENNGIGGAIGLVFGVSTVLLGVGFTTAGVATLRAGAWQGVGRFAPLVNGIWPLVMIGLIIAEQVQLAVGIMAALQVCLGAALIAEDA
ncbi:hypothetical protein [Nocardioides ultimimeridianus]